MRTEMRDAEHFVESTMRKNMGIGLRRSIHLICAFALALILPHDAPAQIRIAMVSHAPENDPWWDIVKNAIRDADRDFGTKTDYLTTPQGGAEGMKTLLEKLGGYDGVISSVPNLGILQGPLQNISGRNIPLITINSGSESDSAAVGAFTHIGMDDYRAGQEAGKRAKSAGVRSFLCISHLPPENPAVQRCKGFGEMIGQPGRAEILQVGKDSAQSVGAIVRWFKEHKRPDAILTLGPLSAEPAIAALGQLSLAGKIYFGTFDLSPAILKAVRDKTIQFAVDQQPYLQGYLPVAIMSVRLKENTASIVRIREVVNQNPGFQERMAKYGLRPSYTMKKISPGPAFITLENMESVEKYAGSYR
jgi:simple sugar transport system substrate-binding protein